MHTSIDRELTTSWGIDSSAPAFPPLSGAWSHPHKAVGEWKPKTHLNPASSSSRMDIFKKIALFKELYNRNLPDDGEVPESTDRLHQLLREGLRAGNRQGRCVSMCGKGVRDQNDAGDFEASSCLRDWGLPSTDHG